jgi:hypothetical protein
MPVHFLAVPVDDELRGGRGDVEFLKDSVPDLIAAAGAVKDEILGQEVGILGVAVELLDQQFAGPSATREKVDEDELVFLFGLRQRLVEWAAHELGRLGRGEGSDEEQAGKCRNLFHAILLARKLVIPFNV